MQKNNDQCCIVECERPLDHIYWDNHYVSNSTNWDIGKVSPPIETYFKNVIPKNVRILIPGCGNAYEAEYLHNLGFNDITLIDIAPTLTANLRKRFTDIEGIKIVTGDFFEHVGEYDYIIEQTFFCALPPTLRQKYAWKMHQLLASNGKLIGLLFNRDFEVSPPFGGSIDEYRLLFNSAFTFYNIDLASNSISARANTELFIEFEKNPHVKVQLFEMDGITCSGCKETIVNKLLQIESVLNVSINTSFDTLMLVSEFEIEIAVIEDVLKYDSKYKVSKIEI
jgi:SAM-dependent methyltransferase